MNKNIHDQLFKINIVDIIAIVLSKIPHSEGINEEICSILFNLCLNDNDIEVLAHVMNAFMDIWSEDNYNYILKKLDIVNKIKSGVNEFRSKVKNC